MPVEPQTDRSLSEPRCLGVLGKDWSNVGPMSVCHAFDCGPPLAYNVILNESRSFALCKLKSDGLLNLIR